MGTRRRERGPGKTEVVAAFRAEVARDLAALARMTEDTREEATGVESRAENEYDTRATEASYLAAGQGRRLVGLRALAEWLDRLDPAVAHAAIGEGALVELDRDDAVEWLLVGPEGGRSVTVDGAVVQLLSVSSPLGRVLDGLGPGDAEEVDTPRGMTAIEVRSVR